MDLKKEDLKKVEKIKHPQLSANSQYYQILRLFIKHLKNELKQ